MMSSTIAPAIVLSFIPVCKDLKHKYPRRMTRLALVVLMMQMPFVRSYPGAFLRRRVSLPTRRIQEPSFHATTICYLNRFLFDPSEVSESPERSVLLGKDDYRTIHAAKILNLANGDTIRAGVVMDPNNPDFQLTGGLKNDAASIEWIPEGKVKKAEVLKNGDPPGSLLVKLGDQSESAVEGDEQDIQVSLILALPRPLQLGRMLPMISQMGVDHLVLTGARKAPKDYFGSHLFRKPEALRERLIEGLCQAGDVRLPKLHTVKNLKWFFEDDLDRLFPADEYARVLAHPQRPGQTTSPMRMGDVKFPPGSERPKIVVAVGPEGGWDEPEELNQFEALGFQQITLGERTLRSDCAVVSLLSLAHEVCHSKSHGN